MTPPKQHTIEGRVERAETLRNELCLRFDRQEMSARRKILGHLLRLKVGGAVRVNGEVREVR